MIVDWAVFLRRLQSYPPGVHVIRPPLPQARRQEVLDEFGFLPEPLITMVGHFNGAKLFMHGLPMLRLFGISEEPPLDELEWAQDWYIDKFTPKWRNGGERRNLQFAIGMTNYGGVMLFEEGLVKEWDTAQRTWSETTYPLDAWLEKVLQEGDAFLRELEAQ